MDYLAITKWLPKGQIASRNYLGNPKKPTVFVHQLVDGKYQSEAFQGESTIKSGMFPELKLTVADIVKASGIS